MQAVVERLNKNHWLLPSPKSQAPSLILPLLALSVPRRGANAILISYHLGRSPLVLTSKELAHSC